LAHSRINCPLPAGVGRNLRWQVDVCGQQSGPCTGTTAFPCNTQVFSYAQPRAQYLSGWAAFGGNTEGGGQFSLQGTDFGPLWSPSPVPGSWQQIDYVRWGPRNQVIYNSTGCAVTSTAPPLITCFTPPGAGFNLQVVFSVGGQVSPTYGSPFRYANPVIASFTGAGATGAATGGGSEW